MAVERPLLACPVCGSPNSRVKDSGNPLIRQRAWKGWTGAGLWRLRQCLNCDALFTTSEEVVGLYPQPKAAHP